MTLNKIIYDRVKINEHNMWDAVGSRAVTPRPGIYFFSVSVGFTYPNNPVVTLVVNSAHHQRQELEVAKAGKVMSYGQLDIVSNARLVDLAEGAVVEAMFFRDRSIYSDAATLATSLSAFYYSPMSNKRVMALNVCDNRCALSPIVIPPGLI